MPHRLPALTLHFIADSWPSRVSCRYGTGKYYNFNNPGFSMQAGQFTQLVWKATTKVGCAAVACNNIGGFGQPGVLAACR